MAYFDFDDKKIYYEEYGTGKPVIVLNGIMMSCVSWAEFIEPWSANNRLILMDMLDQGRSDHMADAFDQSLQVEVVASLIEHLKLECVALLGVSYGGEVALRFALEYQDKVDRLLLFNTTAATGEWLGDIGEAWNKASCDGDGYYLTTIPAIYSPSFYCEHNVWMNDRRKLLGPIFSDKTFIEAMIRLTNSAKNYDIRDRLKGIRVPTLIVSSQEDYLTPVAEQQFIHSQIKDSHYVIIPESGHASMYEQPTLFAALVLGFLNLNKTEFNIT